MSPRAEYPEFVPIDKGSMALGDVYSRLEITVKPFTELGIVNMNAKGTIKNKEMFTRRHHDPVQEADMEQFLSMVDRWVLEYAQLYTAADAV